MEPTREEKRGRTLFVVPHYADAQKLQRLIHEDDMACHAGASLVGSRFQTIIIIRSDSLWGPDTLAWTPKHEQEWFLNTVHTRLAPGGTLL